MYYAFENDRISKTDGSLKVKWNHLKLVYPKSLNVDKYNKLLHILSIKHLVKTSDMYNLCLQYRINILFNVYIRFV